MINFWSKVIRCDENWMDADLDDVVDNIEHVKNLIGIDHIGIGADYDGLSYNDLPIGLEDVSRYPNLFARLLQRPGWTIEDVKKVTAHQHTKIIFLLVEPCDFHVGKRGIHATLAHFTRDVHFILA